jgi:hypothetical protein
MAKVTAHDPDNYYEYFEHGVIVCGGCLDEDLENTRLGNLVGDERVYSGMFRRLKDDHTEPYQCDSCLAQNEAYDQLGDD